jgi:hypothetical protein
MRSPAFAAVLVLSTLLLSVAVLPVSGQTRSPEIPLVWGTWNKASLNVVLHPNSSLSWYSPALLSSVSAAASEWRQALDQFASTYAQYGYLRQIRLSVYVAGVNDSGVQHDVDVRFQNELPPGLLAVDYEGRDANTGIEQHDLVVLGPVVSLANAAAVGASAHELGHVLGLATMPQSSIYDWVGPAPLGGFDLMLLGNNGAYPSTLDLYGAAMKWSWLQSGTFSVYDSGTTCPDSGGSTQPCAVLPSSIPYEQLLPYGVIIGDLASAWSELGVLNATYQSLLGSDSLLQAEKATLSAQVSSLNSSLASLRLELQASQGNDTALLAQVSSMQKELSAMQAQLSEESALKSQVVDLEVLLVAGVVATALAVFMIMRRRRGAS